MDNIGNRFEFEIQIFLFKKVGLVLNQFDGILLGYNMNSPSGKVI